MPLVADNRTVNRVVRFESSPAPLSLIVVKKDTDKMADVVPIYRKINVLFVENDWIIRQVLMEHFALDDKCYAVSFADPAKALDYLRIQCEADRIFSNLEVGGRGGIDLSSGSNWKGRIELAIAPGYDAEVERFRAIEAGLGFFRVKPHAYFDLWHLVHNNLGQSKFK
jgi:hypothetical protein